MKYRLGTEVDLDAICKMVEEAKVLMNTVKKLMAKYDYNTLGGANLLGVKKPVIKGHGAGEAKTFYNMIKEAYVLAKNDMIGKT